MVVGLDTFGAHFADYKDRYVLIGGAASWLVLDAAGLEPRATKDLDIVLCVEALDPAFGRVFWKFIRAAGYKVQEKSEGSKIFYRFRQPTQPGYPSMLELFSRKPDDLVLGDESHLTPIPIGEDVSSLSAILLNEAYYDFLHNNKREIESISIVSEECLIPLKAHAWLDLTARKAKGEHVDSKDIKKHRGDVLRLYQVLNPDVRIDLPESVRTDLGHFLRTIQPEVTTELLNQLGIKGVGSDEVFETIRKIYGMPAGVKR